MAQTTADFLIQRLSQWGVKRIYGYPGAGINGIMGALERHESMGWVQVGHVGMAACMAPAQFRHLIDRAVRIALAERTVTCVIIPHDLQDEAMAQPPHAHSTIHSGTGFSSPRIIPSDADLRRAADVLNAGQRVAMLIGAGALRAADEVIEVADILGAGVAKALLGKAALPDDLRFVTGSIGLLGTKPSWTLMSECDTLLIVGSSFPYPECLPDGGHARGVQI